MQSCLRLRLALRAALLTFLMVLFIVAISRPSRAQATTALPKSWNDALIQLTDKIAASKSPSTPVTLEVKNISSLDDSYVGALEGAFQQLLKAHSFQVLPS